MSCRATRRSPWTICAAPCASASRNPWSLRRSWCWTLCRSPPTASSTAAPSRRRTPRRAGLSWRRAPPLRRPSPPPGARSWGCPPWAWRTASSTSAAIRSSSSRSTACWRRNSRSWRWSTSSAIPPSPPSLSSSPRSGWSRSPSKRAASAPAPAPIAPASSASCAASSANADCASPGSILAVNPILMAEPILDPTVLDPEVPAESFPRRAPELPAQAREPLGRRGLLWILILAILALVLLFVASRFDETLQRTLEAKINQHLQGYTVTLGHAHLSPLGLSLTLRETVIRQQANPEPPVADIPRLKISVEWRQILTGHLVSNAVFVQPKIHVNLPQLRQESRDRMSLKDRGWQQAFEAIYPLKVDHLEVRDGSVVYIDEDPKRPFQISRLNLSASNIRNIQSRDRVYPSALHAE